MGRRRGCGRPGCRAPRYADLLARGSDDPLPWAVDDEDATISINYTSGTTGHAEGRDVHAPRRLPQRPRRERHRRPRPPTVYLWTLPMFHCNGWCHPWAIAAAGGTQVCCARSRPAEIVAT